MTAVRFQIKPYIGDTVFLQLSFVKDGEPFNLSGSTVFFTLKENPESPDSDAVLALVSGDGVTHDGTNAEVYIAGEKTAGCQPGVIYYADVQVRSPDGDIFTAATGRVIFKGDVTKNTHA